MMLTLKLLEYLIKRKNNNAITMEYFVNDYEKLWKMNDKEIINKAVKELKKINICSNPNPIEAFVIRSNNAYPLMTKNYSQELDLIKNYLNKFENYHPIGRAGMFKYNNQDHAMATGLIAARKLLNPSQNFDQWNVNIDAEYIEEIKS
jgi:protoporphyrinogen oxidase